MRRESIERIATFDPFFDDVDVTVEQLTAAGRCQLSNCTAARSAIHGRMTSARAASCTGSVS